MHGTTHTASTAFRHRPPNSARTGYTTEAAHKKSFVSIQTRSELRNPRKSRSGRPGLPSLTNPTASVAVKQHFSNNIQTVLVLFVLAQATWTVIKEMEVPVQCCFTSTETMRIIRDGERGTATSTFTQLLSSDVKWKTEHFLFDTVLHQTGNSYVITIFTEHASLMQRATHSENRFSEGCRTPALVCFNVA